MVNDIMDYQANKSVEESISISFCGYFSMLFNATLTFLDKVDAILSRHQSI